MEAMTKYRVIEGRVPVSDVRKVIDELEQKIEHLEMQVILSQPTYSRRKMESDYWVNVYADSRFTAMFYSRDDAERYLAWNVVSDDVWPLYRLRIYLKKDPTP